MRGGVHQIIIYTVYFTLYIIEMSRKTLTNTEIETFRKTYCDKAYELYQLYDYHGVSMRAIAKAMGCSSMMAYRYFENKEEVFASLRAMLFCRLAEDLESVQITCSPLEYLKAIGIAYVGFAKREPYAYRLLYMIHLHQGKTFPEVEKAQDRTQKVLFKATIRALESGAIKGEPIKLAHALWALIHGLVSLDLSGQLNKSTTFDDLFPSMLNQFLIRT
jgi:AcrR family transcriptional regulator